MNNKRCHIPRLQLYNDLHDSGTQTSKTILELAKMEISGDISPDSLMSTPCDSLTNFDDEILPDVIEKTLPEKHIYKRKQAIYNKETITTRNESNKSLIEMFLAKSKTKNNTHDNRAKFLQQMSPLRYIPKENDITLKSQSYVEPKEQSRFKIKNVRDFVIEKDETKPVRYFSGYENKEIDDSLSAKESTKRETNNFMCPTISSENKNKLPEVQCLQKLISPTRRGRSYSPEEKRVPFISKPKIPYIDQSEDSFACVIVRDKDSGFCDKKLNKTSKPLFEEDLLKIDQISLNLSSEVVDRTN